MGQTNYEKTKRTIIGLTKLLQVEQAYSEKRSSKKAKPLRQFSCFRRWPVWLGGGEEVLFGWFWDYMLLVHRNQSAERLFCQVLEVETRQSVFETLYFKSVYHSMTTRFRTDVFTFLEDQHVMASRSFCFACGRSGRGCCARGNDWSEVAHRFGQ